MVRSGVRERGSIYRLFQMEAVVVFYIVSHQATGNKIQVEGD